MFRSGVPPHIGQSPLPGSEAEAKLLAMPSVTATANAKKADLEVRILEVLFLMIVLVRSFVRRHLDVIDKDLVWRVGKNSRAPLPIAKRIDALESPISRLGFGRRPRLAASSHLSVGQILDLQLQAIPGIRFPFERLPDCARRFYLPGSQLDLLAVAHDRQLVALSHYSGVAHLTPLFRCSKVCLGRVV